MAWHSYGHMHTARCDMCPIVDAHQAHDVRDFIAALKRLGWRFYSTDDGTFDMICPDCGRKKDGPVEVKILEGRA